MSYPVPSPAALQQTGDAFRRRVASFADANHIPVVPLRAADRRIEAMKPGLEATASAGRSHFAACPEIATAPCHGDQP
jgi:hypothetical protein